LLLIDEDSGMDDKRVMERKQLLCWTKELNHKQESLAKQKLRVQRLELRNSNSRYYHFIINWNRAKNEIWGVKIRGRGGKSLVLLKKR